MTEVKIMLDNLQKVNAFVAITGEKDYDIDLISGKYLVNAKSIMGIFSLDLTLPLTVRTEINDDDFLKQIEIFKIEEQPYSLYQTVQGILFCKVHISGQRKNYNKITK